MFESINTILTEEIVFVRKLEISMDYEDDNIVTTYDTVTIDSNVHDISNEYLQHDNPQFKTNKAIRLTNNKGASYNPDDYFMYNGVAYIIKYSDNRPTFNYCVAVNIDIDNIPSDVKILLDSQDIPIEGSDGEDIEG